MSGKLFLDPSTASWLTKAGQDEAQAHIRGGNCHLLLTQVLKRSFNAHSLQWEEIIQQAQFSIINPKHLQDKSPPAQLC